MNEGGGEDAGVAQSEVAEKTRAYESRGGEVVRLSGNLTFFNDLKAWPWDIGVCAAVFDASEENLAARVACAEVTGIQRIKRC